MINPGNLNKRVIVNYPVLNGVDSCGQPLPASWTTGSIWAQVEKRAGDESNKNGNILTIATYIFTVRANRNINEQCYLTYQNKDYDIKFIGEPALGLYKLDTQRRKNNGRRL